MFIEIPASNKSKYQRRPIFGVAKNDAPYMVSAKGEEGKTIVCPYYEKWHSMIRRCYSHAAQEHRPTYKGCTVCKEWLVFSSFKGWMMDQDWDGNELDKDLLVKGNKEYSPSTCIFVSKEVNGAIAFARNKTSGTPTGISKKGDRFLVRCATGGERVFIGSFATLDLAISAYNDAKVKDITEIASRQSEAVSAALLRFVAEL